MRNIKHIITLLATVLLACNAQARTVEIKMSQCAKPYVDNINKVASTLKYGDKLVLNFDKNGKYIIDGTVWIKCNVEIKGVSSQSTCVIVQEGSANGKSKMTDDTFFRIKGDANHKMSAEIRDICFELASHKGILWERAPKHLVKVWFGNGVLIDNVVFKSRNAALTNLDLRECENVVVSNCEFENYNNCNESGCLWSRGKQHNIRIVNNVFRKYGNDEALGCWGGSHEKEFELKNVIVENNEFYFDNKTGSKAVEAHNLITFSHAYGEGAKTYCELDSVIFRDNTITINAPIKRIIVLNFCKYANVKNIELSSNMIFNTSNCSIDNSYLNDIDIISELSDKTNILINNNYISSDCEIYSDGKNSGHTFVACRNANINISNNVVKNAYPQRFIWCHEGIVNLKLEGNQANNVYTSATLSSSKKIDKVSITAVNNTFSGDTRLYCRNVKEMDLVYKDNVFNSTNNHFFLQEAGEKTSLMFEGNTVKALSGSGVFYANYSGQNYKFAKASITNNTFYGINKKSIESSLKQSNKLSIKGNTYR